MKTAGPIGASIAALAAMAHAILSSRA